MKTLSIVLLFMNPIFGFCVVGLAVVHMWYLIPIPVVVIIGNLVFYMHTHKEEMRAYHIMMSHLKKTHEYIGTNRHMTELWQNKETGEIIEL